MGHAPHHNGDECLFDYQGNQIRPRILGSFTEKAHGLFFEFAERLASENQWMINDYPHSVYVGHGQSRIGRVLKTVAYVVVDEDDTGPVVEKWHTKQFCSYN